MINPALHEVGIAFPSQVAIFAIGAVYPVHAVHTPYLSKKYPTLHFVAIVVDEHDNELDGHASHEVTGGVAVDVTVKNP